LEPEKIRILKGLSPTGNFAFSSFGLINHILNVDADY